MKRIRPILLGTLSLMIVLVLAVGCYRPAAPDVTATPGAQPEAAETPEGEAEEGTPAEGAPEEGEPDLQATAIANATLAAQTPEAGEEEPTEVPTEASPVASPTPMPPTPTSPPPATPTASVPITPTEEPAPSEQVTHVVRPGENLFRIALRYGTTVQAIASANGIANPTRIYAGQALVIPSGTEPVEPVDGEMTYVVRPGDNLFRIALRYNMSYLYLARYNNIANPSNIRVGQVIRIPPR